MVYLDLKRGYKDLYEVVDLEASELMGELVNQADSTVEDFMYAGDKLYYLANENPDNRYNWHLVSVDDEGDRNVVDESASYGDYLQRMGGYMHYLDIEGQQRIASFVDTETGEVNKLTPLEPAPLFTTIERDIITFDNDATGVLLTSDATELSRDERNLVVWLHGGPHRQTSPGYHSYTSYAVYDELLEQIAGAGHAVLKLDYPGSYGYGETYKTDIDEEIGDVDVAGVMGAVDELNVQYRDAVLMGNSYGGYLALKTLVEEPTRFDGAVSINGVTDWRKLLSTYPSSVFTKWFNGEPQETNEDLYEQASVIDNLDHLNLYHKLLLVVGEEDMTIPSEQTRWFSDQLDSHDVRHQLLSLATEGHILTEETSLLALCNRVGDMFIDGLACADEPVLEEVSAGEFITGVPVR